MSYKSEKFQQVKDLIKQVDKIADFKSDFIHNDFDVYIKHLTKENESLLRYKLITNNILYQSHI